MAVLCSVPRDPTCLLGEPIVAGMTDLARGVAGYDEVPRSGATSAADPASGGSWAGGLIDVTPTPSDSSVLYGFFRADVPGIAQQFLEGVREQLRKGQATDCEERLSGAVHSCHAEWEEIRGLAGGAVLLQGSDLAYIALDDTLVGIRTFDGANCHTEILAEPSKSQDSPQGDSSQAEELVLPNSADSAFGSLIAVDRSALTKAPLNLQTGCLPLDTERLFLLMGVHLPDSQCEFAFVKEQISRALKSTPPGSSFQTLTPGILRKQHYTGTYSVSIDEPETQSEQFQSKLSFKDFQEKTPFEDVVDSPPQRKTLSSSLTSSSQPYPHYQPTGRDHTEMLSSPSRLGDSSMTIPEDVILPQESMAGQLPPPLLAPIRKAYPTSQEFTITPEMLASPSPIRKAVIGRAASFNSPNGLWMPGMSKKSSTEWPSEMGSLPGHSSLNLSSVLRQDSGSQRERHSHGGHSFGTSSTEERVRGGLPRPTSSSHLSMYSGLTPTASLSASPDANQMLSNSMNSISSLQEQGSKESKEEVVQEPWNQPVPVAGRKGRGRSAALRMLKSNDENKPPSGQTLPYSAPAGLLADFKDSHETDNKGPLSQSIGSRTSGSSGSRTSLNTSESPRATSDYLSRTTSVTSSGGSRTVLCVQPLSEYGNRQPSQTMRASTVTFASTPRLVQNPFRSEDEPCRAKAQEMYGHNRRSDSADNTMDDQFRLEGRQRSGMAFSPSMPDRLGDSVRSLTLTEG